jgi:hypothetical protein
VGKKRVAVMVILMIAVVLVAGAFYFLVIQNPYNNRPIKAEPDKIVMTLADIPSGWTVNRTNSYSYHNSTSTIAPGLNWGAESQYNYSSAGKTWNLLVFVSSWNSTGLAHEQYLGSANNGGNIDSTPISLGDEGCIQMGSFASNGSSARESYNANYAFRVGNIVVNAMFDADGSNVFYSTDWMKGILEIQASKLYRNQPS